MRSSMDSESEGMAEKRERERGREERDRNESDLPLRVQNASLTSTLQLGHTELLASQSSTQAAWYLCMQGSARSLSPRSKSHRQMEQDAFESSSKSSRLSISASISSAGVVVPPPPCSVSGEADGVASSSRTTRVAEARAASTLLTLTLTAGTVRIGGVRGREGEEDTMIGGAKTAPTASKGLCAVAAPASATSNVSVMALPASPSPSAATCCASKAASRTWRSLFAALTLAARSRAASRRAKTEEGEGT